MKEIYNNAPASLHDNWNEKFIKVMFKLSLHLNCQINLKNILSKIK